MQYQDQEERSSPTGPPVGHYGAEVHNTGMYYNQQQKGRIVEEDEAFIAILSQRVARQVADEIDKKARGKAPGTGQRLALAIVSLFMFLVVLVPLFVESQGIDPWILLLVTLIVSMAICIINIVYNISHR